MPFWLKIDHSWPLCSPIPPALDVPGWDFPLLQIQPCFDLFISVEDFSTDPVVWGQSTDPVVHEGGFRSGWVRSSHQIYFYFGFGYWWSIWSISSYQIQIDYSLHYPRHEGNKSSECACCSSGGMHWSHACHRNLIDIYIYYIHTYNIYIYII